MKQRLGVVLVVALVILNAYLIPRALTHADPEPSSAPRALPSSPDGSGAASASASTSAAPQPAPTPTEDSSDGPVLDDEPLLMAARDDTVIEAERGGCAATDLARVLVSTDGAASFSEVEVARGLVAVLALEVTDEPSIELVGADHDCRLLAFTSSDGGERWQETEPPETWRLDGHARLHRVVSPEKRVDTPCRPVTLSAEAQSVVRVLCPDGRVLGAKGDDSWVVLGRLPDATAIRYPTPATGFAVAPGEDCATAVFRTDDGGAEWSQEACLEGVRGAGAIAGQDGRYVARSGGVTLVSDDAGDTWQKP